MTDPAARDHLTEIVTFIVDDQIFGIEITALREIRGWSAVTPLPDTPDHVLGIVNLRGTVLPIIDLAARLGLTRTAPTDRSIIMVTDVDGKMTGLLADRVSDIVAVEPETIQPAPMQADGTRNTFLSGLIARDDDMVGLISLSDVIARPVEQAA